MKIVEFGLAGSLIVTVLSCTDEDFSHYKDQHWREGIVAEVESYYPKQKVEVTEGEDDTGLAKISLYLKS